MPPQFSTPVRQKAGLMTMPTVRFSCISSSQPCRTIMTRLTNSFLANRENHGSWRDHVCTNSKISGILFREYLLRSVRSFKGSDKNLFDNYLDRSASPICIAHCPVSSLMNAGGLKIGNGLPPGRRPGLKRPNRRRSKKPNAWTLAGVKTDVSVWRIPL